MSRSRSGGDDPECHLPPAAHPQISNGNEVSAHSFHLPEQIRPIVDQDGEKYYDHFFVNEDVGYAKIKLDFWEKAVIDEESERDDLVCWIRNPSKGWELCLQRLENGIVKGSYPDLLIIRNVAGIGYVIDILNPHRSDLTDNLSKAKALIDHAQKQPSAVKARVMQLQISRITVLQEGTISPHLRRENRIRTIHSSLAIEHNSLSLEQVTAILDGKRVLGNPNEIKEVQKRLRGIRAYAAVRSVLRGRSP